MCRAAYGLPEALNAAGSNAYNGLGLVTSKAARSVYSDGELTPFHLSAPFMPHPHHFSLPLLLSSPQR